MRYSRHRDDFWRDPRYTNLSNATVGAYCVAQSWCSENRTDGFVSTAMVRRLGITRAQLRQLLTNGVWEPTAAGYRFPDWEQTQQTRAEIELEDYKHRHRSARYRERLLRVDSDALQLPVDEQLREHFGDTDRGAF